MRKVKVILFVVLIMSFTISTSLWAMHRGIDAGEIECWELQQAESNQNETVRCDYHSYTEPGFECPDGGDKICYHCTCYSDVGVTIDTRACECQF